VATIQNIDLDYIEWDKDNSSSNNSSSLLTNISNVFPITWNKNQNNIKFEIDDSKIANIDRYLWEVRFYDEEGIQEKSKKILKESNKPTFTMPELDIANEINLGGKVEIHLKIEPLDWVISSLKGKLTDHVANERIDFNIENNDEELIIRCEIDGYNFWENSIEKEYEINIKKYCFERDLSISMEDYESRFPERFARLIVGSIVCENTKNKWLVSKDKRSLRFRWGSYGKYRKNKIRAYKIDICDEGEIIFSSIEVKDGPFRYLKTPINPDKAYDMYVENDQLSFTNIFRGGKTNIEYSVFKVENNKVKQMVVKNAKISHLKKYFPELLERKIELKLVEKTIEYETKLETTYFLDYQYTLESDRDDLDYLNVQGMFNSKEIKKHIRNEFSKFILSSKDIKFIITNNQMKICITSKKAFFAIPSRLRFQKKLFQFLEDSLNWKIEGKSIAVTKKLKPSIHWAPYSTGKQLLLANGPVSNNLIPEFKVFGEMKEPSYRDVDTKYLGGDLETSQGTHLFCSKCGAMGLWDADTFRCTDWDCGFKYTATHTYSSGKEKYYQIVRLNHEFKDQNTQGVLVNLSYEGKNLNELDIFQKVWVKFGEWNIVR
jgi:hypothetical protein